jgi:hypothetical protein
MYLLQKIDVNVTQENTDILRKPSKVFNSIKAIFQGGLTPTQERQAEVMLLFLQRINIALRESEFDRLASVAVNDNIVYEGKGVESLQESSEALEAGFISGEITKVNTLALTADRTEGKLNYLVHVSIVRKPTEGASPISIQIYGFIDEFKRKPKEDITVFSERVKAMIKAQWGSKAERKKILNELEREFSAKIAKFKGQIDDLFPLKSTSATIKRTIREKNFQSSSYYHNDLYDDLYFYLPYFYEELGYLNFESQGWEEDISVSWDNDALLYEESSDSSWSTFESSDSSGSWFDSGSDSSCGGGCGGD